MVKGKFKKYHDGGVVEELHFPEEEEDRKVFYEEHCKGEDQATLSLESFCEIIEKGDLDECLKNILVVNYNNVSHCFSERDVAYFLEIGRLYDGSSLFDLPKVKNIMKKFLNPEIFLEDLSDKDKHYYFNRTMREIGDDDDFSELDNDYRIFIVKKIEFSDKNYIFFSLSHDSGRDLGYIFDYKYPRSHPVAKFYNGRFTPFLESPNVQQLRLVDEITQIFKKHDILNKYK
jgi:hypothetical protein